MRPPSAPKPALVAGRGRIPGHGESEIAVADRLRVWRRRCRKDRSLLARAAADARGFAKVLYKFDFVELLENFGLILLDYGQKHLRTANGNFKPACYVCA
jgi:hypothetical protein